MIPTLYLEHFGLREAPFKITPTTEFFYGGGLRGEILQALLYAINTGEGIMMITGEVGSGKTMLLRTLMEKLPSTADVVYIANPSLSGREILYNICEELELKIDTERPDTVRRLQDYLIRQHGGGRRVIAFIDEAQAMPDESLEEIRLLSNLETSRHKLLQIVLFGQPELDDKLSRQNMRQLRERITVALQLAPFARDDIREYLSTRLRAAGYRGAQLFGDRACKLITSVSQGLSRRINVLADKALLSAFERSALTVDFPDVVRAAKDANFGKVKYTSEAARRMSKHLAVGLAAACLLVVVAAGGYWIQQNPPAAQTETAASLAPAKEDEAAVPVAGQTVESVAAEAAPESIAEIIVPDADIEAAAVSATVASVTEEEAEGVASPQAAAPTVTVLHTVAAAPAQEGMQAVIRRSNLGDEVFSGDEVSEELSAAAELHAEAPRDSARTAAVWEAAAAKPAALAQNARWSWMPAASYLRTRLNATQTWLDRAQARRGRQYTARLLTVSQQRAVFLEKFLRHLADFYPIRNVMVYPMQLSSGDKFVVTFGVYSSMDDADIFIANMPKYFTGGRPFSQPVAASRQESERLW